MAEESRLTIRINLDKREALKKKAEEEGKNVTEVLTEFIDQYLGLKQVASPLEMRVTRLEKIVEEKLGELAA
ncbi:hypothetical protein VF14_08740 [Nostoc linckia z18]|uniref:Ribbon-helix-helix protein, CopG family n=2 Tax=Nostoc linckia TaxID=92942 RepID=A0A9Q5ZEI8_NOSLI|nr:hypothetical protein [Nostoc linckia]PHK42536.1 hypothetical protein VF12_02385 [Nostoc linckia z15]PHK44510.1 hypothetical protein VF13_21085 [Nostoc linckia z16]PHJ59556.1 hypothetical protein VF02_24365 [Nostoc linckia z1]PHJ65167.1 hypothetical protein VF05_21785 [Nostoc linckia z3]PHJ69559.1 hypothetical protein VF03_23445 [Nostoc linckia z2]